MKCRKLLAILLALVMVIGLLPFAALAEEVPGSSPGDEVSDKIVADQNDPLPEGDPLGTDPEGEPQDEPLPEGDPLGEQPPEVSLLNNEHHAGATALKSTDSELFDGSYYLSEDVKLNKPVKFSGTATLCLNGHKLSCGSDKVITVDGTLTICDCADGGKIEATDRANFAINVERNGTLNVEGGTICGGFRGISGSSNSKIKISDGTIQKSASSTYKALELNGTTATITGGTITGGVELKSSSELSLGGTPAVDTIKLTHKSCSINATASSEAYRGGSITIDYGNLDYRDGTAIVSGVTEENAESFIVTPPKGMVVKFDNGNLVFGEPSTAPGHKNHGANGTGTITGEWQAWNPQTIKTLDDGYYYLDQNYDNLKAITVTGDAYLCLNGHEMSDNGRDAKFIIVNSGASLTICDCSKDKPGRINYKCETGCAIDNKGALKLYSGTIYSDVGNGIYIMSNDGSDVNFDMEGGTIDVGGIGIYFSIGTGVNIKGGTLTYGGQTGVRFAAEGTLTVSRGTIQPRDDGYKKSEGISKIDAGDLYVTGGKISGKQYGIQIANAGDGEVEISGGNISASGEEGYGIYLSKSATANLYLRDTPTISGQEAALNIGKPNAVYASKNGQPYIGDNLTVAFTGNDTEAPIILDVNNNAGKFTLVFPTDKILKQVGNNLVLGTKDVGHQDHDANGEGELPNDAEWIEWDGSAFTEAGYYYLDHDITLESSITIRENINLCLNGCTITYSGASPVFTVESGPLTICDCSTNQAGTIKYDYQSSNCQAIKVNKYGTLNLYGGKVDGSGSRGIFCNGGKVNVYGGTITVTGSNSAIDTQGGTVTLSGGTVSGNIRLRTKVTLNLGTSTITGSVVMRNSATCKGYENTINACANGEAYNGDIITIKPDPLDGDIPVDTVIVKTATEEQASLFSLEGYDLIYKNGTLVVGGDEIELNVTMSESIKYGDTCQVSVSGAPEGATVSYQIEGNTPRERAEISSEGLITPYTTGTFTVTVTADCEGYAQKTVQKTLTVLPKAITITAKDQRLEHGEEIAEGVQQVTVATLVTGDTLYSIDLTASDTAITPDNAVIKQGDADVTAYYDISYESGELTFYNVPQEDFAIIDQPAAVTYGDTFTLDTTGGSGTGTVTWRATGAADVDDEGNVTIIGAGTFIITATKAGNATYQAAEAEVTGTAAPKAITITANDQRLEHGETIEEGVQQVTVAALVAGDTLDSIVLTAGDTDITPSNAVIKKGDTDVSDYYTITYVPGSLTFYNVPQEGFAITGKPATVTYGDTFKLTATGGSGEGAVTWTAEGAAKVDQEGNVTITGAGDFTIKATKAGDDTFAAATATYQGTAQKRALTITADDETIAFNAAAPSYTATVTGAVKADEAAIVAAYALTSTYVKGDPVDDYPITVTVNLSADLLEKYTVTKKDGTLHVVKALAEVVKAPDAVENLVYTGKAQKLVTAGEAKNGTMVYSLNGTTYQEAVPTRINAGTYTVWYKVVGNNGYSDTAAKSFTVTIKKAPLTVTADDIWVYAGNTPKFTVTITGYVNGEDWHELGGKLTFTCGYSEKYSKPGSRHTIYPEGLRADNYDITFETGTLTVKDPLSPRFNVYVLDSKHGTVEADCRYARKGDVVTLTIKPDWGYELETLTVTDSHGYELKLTYHSNGTYTFTMPRDNVTVKAIFTVRDMPFVDVPGDAWYAGGVRYVYAHGLMNGTGSWRFSPNRTTTRAMIATILYRMEGSPRVYGTSRFGDVEAGSWYEDAVIWATQNDIVEGYTSKTFGPNDPITREQMAAMLYRYADYCRCDMSAGRYVDLSKFSDMNEISDYAIPALRWAVGEEIIQGRTGKRLAPTDTATRAEVAVMLMRFCEDVIW